MTRTTAERARSVVATASTVEVGVLSSRVTLERHVADLDGSLLFCVPRLLDGGEAALGAAALMPAGLPMPVLVATATDVASVAQADRLRGVVRVTGAVTPAPGPLPDGVAAYLGASAGRPVLRLGAQRVSLDWRVGSRDAVAVPVDVDAYAAADLDPLVGWESEWTEHLARDHRKTVGDLLRALRPDLGAEVSARPLLADRTGLTLRAYVPGRAPEDVHLPLGGPVRCGCEAREALNDLLRTRLGGAPAC